MSQIEEIERAILELSTEDFTTIARRVQEIEQERWDSQLDADARAGKLGFLREDGQRERQHGSLTDWPPPSS